MLYDRVELHNIEALTVVKGRAGLRMQRVPEYVRERVNRWAQVRYCDPACAEIRFVAESPVTITLSCPEGEGNAEVFFGPFQSRERHQISRKPKPITVSMPDTLKTATGLESQPMAFSPKVCRLMLSGSPLFLHKIEGDAIRPPFPSEVPHLRYLAYGTSITQAGYATGPHLTYVEQVGIRLDVDVINLGVGGSALCEPELAEYMASRRDWDFATLALSVNMLKFPLRQFYERVAFMIRTLSRSNPRRPVVCITLYPYAREFGDTFIGLEDQGTPEDYRQELRRAAADCRSPNVHLIEGPEILTSVGGLSPDLLHPADQGMIIMGENLAKRLAPIIAQLRPEPSKGPVSEGNSV